MTGKVVSTVFCIILLLQFDAIVGIPVAGENATTIRAIPLDSLEAASTSIPENPTNTSDDDTKLPPLIFPSDTSTYKILPPNHPTTLKFIQMLNESKDKIATSTTPLSTTVVSTQNDVKSTTLNEDYYSEDYTADSHEKKDDGKTIDTSNDEGDEMDPMNDEVEEIEDNGDLRPQSVLEEQFSNDNLKTNFLDDDGENADIESSGGLSHGHIAILFGGFILLSLTLYLSLIYYRNKLEQRYGMRERLVTEDDYYTNSQNDLRYFGVS